jgi:hypothetical protein
MNITELSITLYSLTKYIEKGWKKKDQLKYITNSITTEKILQAKPIDLT